MAFKKLIDTLEEFQGLYLKAIAKQIKQKDIVASGALGDSVNPKLSAQPKVSVFGNLYEMKVEMNDYGDEIDQGTQPSGKMPNNFKASRDKNKIYLWLTYPNVIDRLKIQGIDDEERKSIAYFVSRSIEKNGKKARPFLSAAIDPIHKQLKPRFADAVGEAVVFSIEEMYRIIEENK